MSSSHLNGPPSTTVPAIRPGYPSGMVCLDTSGSTRIPLLMELVGALSRANDPQTVLRTFSRGFTKLYGAYGYISLSTRGLAPGEYRVTRFLQDVDPETRTPADPWSTIESIPVHRGGFLGGLIRSAYPEVIHHLNVRDDPVLGNGLTEFGSIMAIPLFDDGEPLNWSIALQKDPEGFTLQELEESILRNNLVGGTVKNTLISKQLRDAHTAIHREVDQIASIQRALLPDRMPTIQGVSIAASYETFDRAGGDYYDVLPLAKPGQPDERWGLVIADASGHGPAAAVVMAMVQSLLHAFPTWPDGPGEALNHVNQHLSAKRIENSFVTALFAIYCPKSRQLSYARAGHPPPLLMSAGADGWQMARLDDVGSVPLGILDDCCYEQTTIQLEPGQTLVLYTDGITESMSPEGTMFTVEGIERSLTACTGHPDCVIGHVSEELEKHQQSVRPNDDQTLVVMRINEP